MSSIHLLIQGRAARAVPGEQTVTIPASEPCFPAGWAGAKPCLAQVRLIPWESAVV